MSARRVERCELCGGSDLELVLSLGSSPPTCSMAKVGDRPASEDHYPLELLLCHGCSLVQLSVVVDPEVLFPPDYPYSSGNSKALHEDFEDLVGQAELWHHALDPDDLVVDIGANDGTLLSKFPCRRVGVEPTVQAVRIDGEVYPEFFSETVAQAIVAKHGQAKVVTACNVLAHVEDIHDVMRGINTLLAHDGILIAENHNLASIVDGGQWDTVYHEHLRYYDPYSFHRLLIQAGLWAEDWQDIPTHGGSFRVIATRGRTTPDIPDSPREYDWDAFRERVQKCRWQLRSTVSALRHGDRRIGAIGATARATTIINSCGFDADDIEAVYEVADSDKISRYIPGTQIPVVDEVALRESYAPDTCILFAWYMADVVVPKLRQGIDGYKGQLIVPLPDVKTLRTPQQMGRVPA